MKKIILIGAGGHCVSCVDVIELQRKFKIVDAFGAVAVHGYAGVV